MLTGTPHVDTCCSGRVDIGASHWSERGEGRRFAGCSTSAAGPPAPVPSRPCSPFASRSILPSSLYSLSPTPHLPHPPPPYPPPSLLPYGRSNGPVEPWSYWVCHPCPTMARLGMLCFQDRQSRRSAISLTALAVIMYTLGLLVLGTLLWRIGVGQSLQLSSGSQQRTLHCPELCPLPKVPFGKCSPAVGNPAAPCKI